MHRRGWFLAVGALAGALVPACSSSDTTSGAASTTSTSGGAGGPPLPTGLTAEVTDTRFTTADHMIAGIEMQISGEPFAELLGRDIGGQGQGAPA